jgi:hypothetical protein
VGRKERSCGASERSRLATVLQRRPTEGEDITAACVPEGFTRSLLSLRVQQQCQI